ncbi:MAG: type IV pilus secretin PilQ [Acidobacteria bacterium]|nr:type IV pilus secretin PilQ [Acidobacteriota bacterium]
MTRHVDRGWSWLVLVALIPMIWLLAPSAQAGPADDRPALLASAPAPATANPANRLLDVGAWPDGDGAYEVVLRGDGGMGYQVFTLTDPDRVIVDIPGVRAGVATPRVEVSDDGLLRVRVGQFRESPEPVARVVLDLSRPMAWTVHQDDDQLAVRLGAPQAPQQEAAAVQPAFAGGAVERPLPVAASAPAAPAERPAPEAAVETTPAASLEPAAAPVTTPAAPAEAPAAPQPVQQQAVPAADATDVEGDARAWSREEVQKVLEAASGHTQAPAAATTDSGSTAEMHGSTIVALPNVETQTIEDGRRNFTGAPISLELVDADLKQVFGVFHDLSGLNFVLDPAVGGAVTIIVEDVPWDQALDLILKNNNLDMVLEGNVVRVAPVTRLAQEAAQRKALFEAKELEAPPVTITRTLSYAKAKDVEKIVREAIVSPKGRVIIDERTNTLIIRDIPTRVEATDKLLTTLDSETPQVMIEARIVEVSRDFVHELGVRWGFSAIADPALGTQTSLDFPHRARVDYDLNLPKNPAANSLGFSFGNVLDSFTLDVTIDALENEGYARRLSAPKIATQNNEPAEIEQGVRIPVVSTTATEIDVRFVAASLRLRCTPQITAEGTVVLDIEVENNSPDFVNTVGDVPAINTQRAETKVLIADGGTTVIGGIFSVNEGKSEIGVPFFRHIPVLGWLFKSKSIEQRNRELLIFLTPRIIKAA